MLSITERQQTDAPRDVVETSDRTPFTACEHTEPKRPDVRDTQARLAGTPTRRSGRVADTSVSRDLKRTFCSVRVFPSSSRLADRALGRRGRRRKSVEDMGTEPVSRWNVGVLEI